MARTFDSARDKTREEDDDEPGGGGGEYNEMSSVSYEGQTLQQVADEYRHIAIPTPSDLRPEGARGREQERRENTQNLQENLFGQIGLSLEEIEQSLQEGQSVDLDQANRDQLLAIIAQSVMDQNKMMQALLSTNVSQLQTQLEMADSVAPARSVVVSGTNQIDDANTPQPVIPQADKTDIPTKTLHLRASPDNKQPIYIGDDSITPEDGFVLKKGESKTYEFNFVGDTLWMASEEVGDEVQLLGTI